MSHSPEHVQVLRLLTEDGPQPGEKFRHFKGGLYTIVGTGLLEADLSPVVIYTNQDRILWVRTLKNFQATVKTDDGKKPRFVKET